MPAQTCTRHPSRETYRICGRCERPFCPDCLVDTPVGGRCRECARPARSARLIVAPWRWPLVALTALLGGFIAGTVVWRIGFFGLFLSFIAGQLIAGGALAASGRKPGLALAVVTAAFIVLGVILGAPVPMVAQILQDPEATVPLRMALAVGARAALMDPWNWISAALMAGSAYTRIR